MEFDVMNILYYCAVILLFTKLFGIATRKIGLPQVVGMIIAGLLIGPAIFGQLNLGMFKGLVTPSPIEMDVLKSFSQIGVVFILFSSGLETDFNELKRSGAAATVIALAGVLVPVALGTGVSLLFMGGDVTQEKLMNALFVGMILAATSVGITVETLKELGKLNTRVGTTILSAAIIDDVLGIILLSIVTSLGGGGNIITTLLKAVGFFAFTIGIGILLRFVFKHLSQKYPHKRRTGIFALAMCFFFAFCAERLFGIAAITGAYMAGLMLSGLNDTAFVDRKVVISGYMIFTPMFFAYIGISADFSHFKSSELIFAFVFVAVGIIGKIIGCSLVSKPFHYSNRESLTIGCGMIARGEVALAIYATGQGLICRQGNTVTGIDPLVPTILLIVVTSILCPIFLKLVFKNQKHETIPGSSKQTTIHSEAIENTADEA